MEKKISIAVLILAAFFFLGASVFAFHYLRGRVGTAAITGFLKDNSIEIKPRDAAVPESGKTAGEKPEDSQNPVSAGNPGAGLEVPAGTDVGGQAKETPDAEIKKPVAASKKVKKAKKTEEKAETRLCEPKDDFSLRGSVIFNEIAWMGTAKSYSDEWMELKNIAKNPLDLEGWQIQNQNRQIKIIFKKGQTLASGGLFLLERTNDDTVPETPADFVYSGSLGNQKETLYLFDRNCQLQDSTVAAPDWPAGDNGSKRTMERRGDLLWQTSAEPGGTPKKENSGGFQQAGGAGGADVLAAITGLSGENHPKLVINEIMYDPEGSDDGREWIEIYNNGTTTADLSGWKLFEGEANHKLSLVRGQASVPALGYAVITNAAGAAASAYPDCPGSVFHASFSLKNGTGESIALKVGDFTADSLAYRDSWGAKGNGYSLQRKEAGGPSNDPANWQAFVPTPGSSNSPALLASAPAGAAARRGASFFSPSGVEIDQEPVQPAGTAGEGSGTATTTIAAASVVINEIAWMGTATSTTDEWIELYNNTAGPIDLSGWKIGIGDDSFYIDPALNVLANATTTIPALGFYLIERKSGKKTASNILDAEGNPLADMLAGFGNGLNNNGEILELFDAAGNLADKVDCEKQEGTCKKWFAGDNSTGSKRTMERIDPGKSGADASNWKDSEKPGGTPKK